MSPDAVLLTDGDFSAFPLWYAQGVLGVRPDVVLVEPALLDRPWYREQVHRRAPDILGSRQGEGVYTLAIIVEQALKHRALFTTMMLSPEFRVAYQGVGPVWRVSAAPLVGQE